MTQLQDVYFRFRKNKEDQKKIRATYREALGNTPEHGDVVDKIKALREQKRQIEEKVRAQFFKEFEQIDELKTSESEDKVLLGDLVLSHLMKGEIVKVRDENNNSYDPIVKIIFQKSDEQET